MPNPSIELAADAPAATIQVRYVDTSGELQGPFPIKFDPEAALIHDQRKILNMTATSWLSFREFNGLPIGFGGADLPRRQRVGDQELPALK
jgi:hypothetical protein